MGASKSKEGKVLSKPGEGGALAAASKPAKGVVIPEDTVPYPGLQVQYHLINVQVWFLFHRVGNIIHCDYTLTKSTYMWHTFHWSTYM